jgi:hypothetical protein
MQKNTRLTGIALLLTGLLGSPLAAAFDFGNMMNPSRWFGGGRDYHDDYYDGPWGPGYGPGPGYYGAPPVYGAPGYAPPAYGAPAYGYAQPAYSAPASTDTASTEEIRKLKRRIEELEQEQAAIQAGTYNSYPSYPSPAPAAQSGYDATGAADGTGSAYPNAVPPPKPAMDNPPPIRPGAEWRPSGYTHPGMPQYSQHEQPAIPGTD